MKFYSSEAYRAAVTEGGGLHYYQFSGCLDIFCFVQVFTFAQLDGSSTAASATPSSKPVLIVVSAKSESLTTDFG